MVCLQLFFYQTVTKPIAIKYKMHELTQFHDQFVHFQTVLGIDGTDNKQQITCIQLLPICIIDSLNAIFFIGRE